MSDLTEAVEAHGVWATGGDVAHWVVTRELRGGVSIEVPFAKEPVLTPPQARYLARKLYRLARRSEQRKAGEQ